MIVDQRYKTLVEDRILRETIGQIYLALQVLESRLQQVEKQTGTIKPAATIDVQALTQSILQNLNTDKIPEGQKNQYLTNERMVAVLQAHLATLLGKPSGIATLDGQGKVKADQWPALEAAVFDVDGGMFPPVPLPEDDYDDGIF